MQKEELIGEREEKNNKSLKRENMKNTLAMEIMRDEKKRTNIWRLSFFILFFTFLLFKKKR